MAIGSLLAGAGGGAVVNIIINAVDKTSGVVSNINKNMLAMGAGMVAVGVIGVSVMNNLGKEASNLGESINAVNVVFGENSDAILKAGKDSAKSFGMSKEQFNSSAVRFSAFADVIVGEGGDVAGIITELTGRTADFASVMNIDMATAQTLMSAGLAGETEGLRRYGIDVSAATVQSYAYANGIAEAGEKLTEAQKIQARYEVIMAATDKTAGDFVNTSDSLANRQRILTATFTDLKAELGTALVPAFEKVLGVAQWAIDLFTALPGPVKAGIIIVAALASILLILAGVITIVTATTAAFTAANIWWIGIILAVMAVIAGVIALWKNWDKISVKVKVGLWLLFAPIMMLITLGKLLIKHWDKVKEAAGRFGVGVKNVFIGIANVVLKVWNFIISVVEKAINNLSKKINPMLAMAKKVGLGPGEIGEVSLGKFLADPLEFAKFTPSVSTNTGDGSVTNINVQDNNIYGTDPDAIAEALNDKLGGMISL